MRAARWKVKEREGGKVKKREDQANKQTLCWQLPELSLSGGTVCAEDCSTTQ